VLPGIGDVCLCVRVYNEPICCLGLVWRQDKLVGECEDGWRVRGCEGARVGEGGMEKEGIYTVNVGALCSDCTHTHTHTHTYTNTHTHVHKHTLTIGLLCVVVACKEAGYDNDLC